MERVKSFYCMGVPRSGTTYFANLMNSHPNVVCGMECFPPGRLQLSWLSRDNHSQHATTDVGAKHWRDEFAKKTNVLVVGDKFPRAYFNYKKVLSQLPEGKVFITIRSMKEVFCSWDDRAKNSSDSWSPGMIWFFAYMEFLHLLSISSTYCSDNVYFVNYDYLVNLRTRRGAAENIFSIINMNMPASVDDFLKLSEGRTRASVERVRLYNELQSEILSLKHMVQYEKLFKAVTITPVSLLADEINSYTELALIEIVENKEIYIKVVSEICKNNRHFAQVWSDVLRPRYIEAFECEHLKNWL